MTEHLSNKTYEVNFDGLVGPTYFFGGLSSGNMASTKHKNKTSNPKKAALQGLEKMKLLMDLGIKQAVLPPQMRPDISILRSLGFIGSDASVIDQAEKVAPELLQSVLSASSMWSANSATIAPSSDSADNLVHITPANLGTLFHRAIETETTTHILKAIFKNPKYFIHHAPLPSPVHFSDEGSANHMRFSTSHASMGVHLFVFGKNSLSKNTQMPKKNLARQSREASESVARLHLLPADRVLFAQQNPKLIDKGVFHNDVISTNNENVFLYYEDAFVDTPLLIETIHRKMFSICNTEAICIKISKKMLPFKEALSSYLFNSQIVTLPDGSMAIIAPLECKTNTTTHEILRALISDRKSPIRHLHFVDIQESMKNGGGPACLRLRVLLKEKELAAINPHVLLNDTLYHTLKQWISKHYRESLTRKDLSDPDFLKESQNALIELSTILHLPNIHK
ncbi:MAG: N-succinylarginine dihydrolase [Chlamydiales bacterium]|nr:N-succinylarginine dihydrolase [Chlamydiales bacterium]